MSKIKEVLIMWEKNMRFGDFIKQKRLNDPRELTLKDMSERLGISLSFLSDNAIRRFLYLKWHSTF
jgi:hypothetical protein